MLNFFGFKNENDIEKELVADGYQIDKKWNGASECLMLSLDKKQFIVTPLLCRKNNKERKYIDFSNIVDVELIIDKQELTKRSGLGRAVVGGILLGGIGAIAGGLTGETTQTSKFKDIDIVLHMKDVLQPIIKFTVNNISAKSTECYGKIVLEKAQDITETITRIIEQEAKEEQK